MKKVFIERYDAFTDQPNKGNPTGVIFDADRFSDLEMQQIAFKLGLSECCFLCKSEMADIKLRYFMPQCETALCGHATVASIFAFMEKSQQKVYTTVSIETMAGVLEVSYDPQTKEVHMSQPNAKLDPFEGDAEKLAEVIGLSISDFDTQYPIVYGNTGVWTVIIPIKNLSAFNKMNPCNPMFAALLAQHDHASIHPITFECVDKKHFLHSRHFSSTFAGTTEDPVTGTASGVMGAYYLHYISPDQSVDLLLEQGNEMGCDGTVHVWAKKVDGEIEVSIAGTAVKSADYEIELD